MHNKLHISWLHLSVLTVAPCIRILHNIIVINPRYNINMISRVLQWYARNVIKLLLYFIHLYYYQSPLWRLYYCCSFVSLLYKFIETTHINAPLLSTIMLISTYRRRIVIKHRYCNNNNMLCCPSISPPFQRKLSRSDRVRSNHSRSPSISIPLSLFFLFVLSRFSNLLS